MKNKKVEKTETEISDGIKKVLFKKINDTINEEIIKSLKTGIPSDYLTPYEKIEPI